MTPHDALEQVLVIASTVGAYVAAFTTLVIAITYRSFFNYRRTRAGIAFSQFMMALAAVFILATLARLFGPAYPFRSLLTTVVFGWWAVTSVRIFVELIRSWRHGEPRLFDIEPKPRKKEQS